MCMCFHLITISVSRRGLYAVVLCLFQLLIAVCKDNCLQIVADIFIFVIFLLPAAIITIPDCDVRIFSVKDMNYRHYS